jgi:hypothetical protein
MLSNACEIARNISRKFELWLRSRTDSRTKARSSCASPPPSLASWECVDDDELVGAEALAPIALVSISWLTRVSVDLKECVELAGDAGRAEELEGYDDGAKCV